MWDERWQVHISQDNSFAIKVYFYKPAGNETDVMYPTGEGEMNEWRVERFPSNVRFPPTFTLGLRVHAGVLKSFAEALAQLGYSAVDTGRETKAQAAHIASLEKTAERLFSLAERNPVIIKSAT